MAAQRGFCPYCAHVNPPDFKFCVNCQRKLPPEVLGEVAVGPPSKEDLDAAAGGEPTEPPEPAPPKSARWIILVLTVGIALVVLVASIGLLTHFLSGSPGGATSGSGSLIRMDLCVNNTGWQCKGTQITFPYMGSNGASENVSQCYAVYPKGSSPRLSLNFTTSAKIYGVLIPQPLYNGPSVSYYVDPVGFYNNGSAVALAAWNSGPVEGAQVVNVTLPSISTGWCLAWWSPGSSYTLPGTVTLTSDAYLLTPD